MVNKEFDGSVLRYDGDEATLNNELVSYSIITNVEEIPLVIEKMGKEFVLQAINKALKARAYSNWYYQVFPIDGMQEK